MSEHEKPEFEFTEEHWDELVQPLYNDIFDSLKDMQKETGCPNHMIASLLQSIASLYSEEA